MAYIRTNWEDREVEKPRTYTRVDNLDGTITLTPAEGTIFSAGTPIVAQNMNNIEDQLVVTDTHIANKSNPHAVTASQVGAYAKAEADSAFQEKLSSRINTQLYLTVNKSWLAGKWENLYFSHVINHSSEFTHLGGKGVTATVGGWYHITLSASIGNLSTTGGYILARMDIGTEQWRVDARHFTSTGNINVTGSIIDYVPAGAEIRPWVYCSANFDTIGAEGEYRTWMNIRQLL